MSSVSCDPLSLFEVFSGRWASVRIKALLNNCLFIILLCPLHNGKRSGAKSEFGADLSGVEVLVDDALDDAGAVVIKEVRACLTKPR